MSESMRIFRILTVFLLLYGGCYLYGQNLHLAEVEILETAGFPRVDEYVEIDFQSDPVSFDKFKDNLVARDLYSGQEIPCQVISREAESNGSAKLFTIIFPVSLVAKGNKRFGIQQSSNPIKIDTDFKIMGSGIDLIIENQFYRADLSRSTDSEAKSHASGQLRELLIKLGFDQLLFRTENRMHWAPNFQRKEAEEYQTIAGWDNLDDYRLYTGPYLVQTVRSDSAPNYPEIWLMASYKFYFGKPYFRFFSLMEMVKEINLKLLRNDEMTMDSMFTNVAFQRPNGHIEDYGFPERYPFLERQPIENEAPWLCFYHKEKEYGFASIRLKYDVTDRYGNLSPTFLPHTMISDGAKGGKYWNRRMINDHPVLVPAGSRYLEENAYLVFSIHKTEPFAEIKYWADRLRQPVQVKIIKNFQ
jgi:hypothetical protein